MKYDQLLEDAMELILYFPEDWALFCRRMNILQPDDDDRLDFLLWVRS
jgi:hypothetical protein